MYTKATSQFPNAMVGVRNRGQNERYVSDIFDNKEKINEE
jgi:hypothetical protein